MQIELSKITTDTIYSGPENDISVNVLRLDKIHPVISGNKWFKLKYYLREAKEQGKTRIVTFGGPWSNHIVATAAMCKSSAMISVGIIRGEEPVRYSATLNEAKAYGMELYFMNREDYKQKTIPLSLQNDNDYVIDEGGFGMKGAIGAAEILDFTSKDFTHCCCAVGTGTMMAGLTQKLLPEQTLIGISTLKNHYGLELAVQSLIGPTQKQWNIHHDYSFGGYAKHTPALIQFMNDFYKRTGIPSDFVYTAKLFFGIEDLIKNKYFPPGSKLILVHSGGLQGNKSLPKGTLIY